MFNYECNGCLVQTGEPHGERAVSCSVLGSGVPDFSSLHDGLYAC